MQLLQELTDDKVINRLFKLLEKVAKDLKKPASDSGDGLMIHFYDNCVFTTPTSGVIPHSIYLEFKTDVAYVKPLLGVLPALNFSINVTELEPLTEFLTKAQPPSQVLLSDLGLEIVLKSGDKRTFPLDMAAVDVINDFSTTLTTHYRPSSIIDYELPFSFMDSSFGGRGSTYALEINLHPDTQTIQFNQFLPDGINTRLLRKNVVAVKKKIKTLPGTTEKVNSYPLTKISYYVGYTYPDRGYLRLDVDGDYYRAEQVYIVYQV